MGVCNITNLRIQLGMVAASPGGQLLCAQKALLAQQWQQVSAEWEVQLTW